MSPDRTNGLDDITVVVINYRTLDLTERCITSLRLYYPQVQLLVSDNGSADESTEYLRGLGKADPFARVILHKRNLHHGPALHHAVQAAGTPEQREKFLTRFAGEKPVFDAMCMTEAGAGSDTSAIRSTAVLDKATNEWILNGEKIFVTAGDKSLTPYEKFDKGFIVVWATLDPKAGRAGMRAFVVEAGTPGVKVTKLEHKMGIRVSDTASVVLQDARVPFDHILGSSEVVKPEATTKGFKGAMATFDATRPLVGAMAIGVARATVEMVKELLAEQGIQIRYGLPRNKLTSLERDVIEMEVLLRSAWLLVLKAVWMADNRIPNSAEASMCKVRAGDVVTRITQKAVEIMGPLGYTTETLLEKWFRDAKISDIYEGTGQINRLIVARNVLGYSGRELR